MPQAVYLLLFFFFFFFFFFFLFLCQVTLCLRFLLDRDRSGEPIGGRQIGWRIQSRGSRLLFERKVRDDFGAAASRAVRG